MLNKNSLKTEIRKISDEGFNSFEGFPEDKNETAERWSEAIKIYSSSIIPYSLNIGLAKKAMREEIKTNYFIPTVLELSLIKFTQILASGMLPNFNGVPPASKLNIESCFLIGFGGGSSEEVAECLSVTIDSWFKTGTAINTTSGGTINWK